MLDQYCYKAHVIRDLFATSGKIVVVYGPDDGLVKTLRSPVYSIETWHLDPENEDPLNEFSRFWDINNGNTFFGQDFCDVFIIEDFLPEILIAPGLVRDVIFNFLRSDGLLVTTNHSFWGDLLSNVLIKRKDLEEAIQRYSMYRNQKVGVLQKP